MSDETKETLKQMLQHYISKEHDEADKCLSDVIKIKAQEIVSNFTNNSADKDTAPETEE